MSEIKINRRGHYRATFKSAPHFALIVPVQWHPQLTFRDLLAWPGDCDWGQLEYVKAPKTADENRIAL